MRIDYHMHFEYGSYDLEWVQGFFDQACERGLDEIGISEHSHGFSEFKDLYYRELILDQSPVGQYQQQWLTKNKFRYSIRDYLEFMDLLKKKSHKVKTGIEVCNFQEQVRTILARYSFDYIIGSVHFLKGWGYDFADLKFVWNQHNLQDIYEWYTAAIEALCAAGLYDILGHPFNLRLFKHFPDFDVQPFLDRAAKALYKAGMAIDINTGTLYRYPVKEISPYPAFMQTARKHGIPIILSSDAHRPEDCGRHIDTATEYAKKYGYEEVLVFTDRKAVSHKLS
jgi:histidinol-phosphatase (PHP family)